MDLSGLFPKLQLTDQTDDVVTYSQLMAELLDMPSDQLINYATGTATITATSQGTLIPNLTDGPTLTLTKPAYVMCVFNSIDVRYTSGSSTNYGRILFGWDGALTVIENGAHLIPRFPAGYVGPVSWWRMMRYPAGTTRFRAYAYKTVSGDTYTMAYPRLQAIPLRPIVY
jgi:hypothetical protein